MILRILQLQLYFSTFETCCQNSFFLSFAVNNERYTAVAITEILWIHWHRLFYFICILGILLNTSKSPENITKYLFNVLTVQLQSLIYSFYFFNRKTLKSEKQSNLLSSWTILNMIIKILVLQLWFILVCVVCRCHQHCWQKTSQVKKFCIRLFIFKILIYLL